MTENLKVNIFRPKDAVQLWSSISVSGLKSTAIPITVSGFITVDNAKPTTLDEIVIVDELGDEYVFTPETWTNVVMESGIDRFNITATITYEPLDKPRYIRFFLKSYTFTTDDSLLGVVTETVEPNMTGLTYVSKLNLQQLIQMTDTLTDEGLFVQDYVREYNRAIDLFNLFAGASFPLIQADAKNSDSHPIADEVMTTVILESVGFMTRRAQQDPVNQQQMWEKQIEPIWGQIIGRINVPAEYLPSGGLLSKKSYCEDKVSPQHFYSEGFNF